MRPQRGSRAISTMGEYTQQSPSALASIAAMRALRSISAVSQEQESPSGMGKMVLCPCITSSPKMSGMCNRLSFTARVCAWRILSGPKMPNRPPTRPLRILSSTPRLTTDPVGTPQPGVTKFNWPIFSSSVILARRLATYAFILALLVCAVACNRKDKATIVKNVLRIYCYLLIYFCHVASYRYPVFIDGFYGKVIGLFLIHGLAIIFVAAIHHYTVV